MARSATAARAPAARAPAPAPVRRPARPRPARRARRAPAPSPRAAIARAGTARVLDGLLRGRLWIALVGVLLVGIVFSNVSLLQRNREIARTAEYSTEVKRANERLRAQLARLGSNERVQRAAAAQGFALPAPADVEYLRAGGADDAAKALAQVRERNQSQSSQPAAPTVPETAAGPAAGGAPTASTGPQPTGQAPPAAAPPAAAPAPGVGQ